MATHNPNSGAAVKKNSGTVLQGGNVNTGRFGDSLLYSTTLTTNANVRTYGSMLFEAVSPNSSGNVGTLKPASAGKFANLAEGKYIAMMIMTHAAGVANTLLAKPAGDLGHQRRPRVKTGDRRLHVTSWDRATGSPTYGGSRGASFTFATDSEQGSVVDHAYVRNAFVPAELTYMDGGIDPVMDDYATPTAI